MEDGSFAAGGGCAQPSPYRSFRFVELLLSTGDCPELVVKGQFPETGRMHCSRCSGSRAARSAHIPFERSIAMVAVITICLLLTLSPFVAVIAGSFRRRIAERRSPVRLDAACHERP